MSFRVSQTHVQKVAKEKPRSFLDDAKYDPTNPSYASDFLTNLDSKQAQPVNKSVVHGSDKGLAIRNVPSAEVDRM